MLVNREEVSWWYMEVPRTGSTTIDRGLRKFFPKATAIYKKHWPVLPPEEFVDSLSIVSVRNPYSRAVSCWQYFTNPQEISFLSWLQQRLTNGFTEDFIEAQPQALWYDLMFDWNFVLRQENLEQDFWDMVSTIDPAIQVQPLETFNSINGPWVNYAKVIPVRDRPWFTYYDAKEVAAVQELYVDDFDALSSYYSKDFEVAFKLNY